MEGEGEERVTPMPVTEPVAEERRDWYFDGGR